MLNTSNISYLLMCWALCASPLARAVDFSVEDGIWKTAPVQVSALIERYEGDTLVGCVPFQIRKLAGEPALHVVTTQELCWGNSAAPLWLVELGARPRVLLHDGGYVVAVTHRRTGMPDIVITRGSAGHCHERLWRFTSRGYSVVRESECL